MRRRRQFVTWLDVSVMFNNQFNAFLSVHIFKYSYLRYGRSVCTAHTTASYSRSGAEYLRSESFSDTEQYPIGLRVPS